MPDPNMTRNPYSLGRLIDAGSLLASLLVSCTVCIPSALAQVPFPPGSYGLWSSSTQLSTSTTSCQPTPANGLKLIQNRGVVGILLSVGWQDVEIADGTFDWTQVDRRLQEAAVCGIAVELSLVIGLWHTPDWLLDPAYGIQTISLINQNRYQTDCGASHVTPVYWDPTLQSYRVRFINEADNLQPWRDAGYNPSQETPSSVVFNAAVAIIDATAAAFPLQSLKLPIQVTHELPDGTKTALAEAVTNYADGAYPGRFFAQLNFLKTDSPLSTDPALDTADPNTGRYIFKLLRDHASEGVGIQMVAAAINGANPTDNCRLNDSVHPCSPSDDPPVSYSTVLQWAVDVGLSYTPTFVEYWSGDSKTLTTPDDVDAMRQVFTDATYAMGGVPRGEM